MKILIVASYNKKRYAPFIIEQAESLRSLGCKVVWFGVVGKGSIGYLRVLPRLRKMISDERPDIIHAHYGMCCLLANLATRKVPIVSTYHGSDINLVKVRLISKIAMWMSAWNIFVSKRNMALARAVEGKKASLIPCGVVLSDEQLISREEARKMLGWNIEEKKVLFAGAFDTRAKNAGLAKQAIALLDDVELIELRGYSRSEVNRLMCAVNCLLMTSFTEGSPQVIKEAMACGCPIVSVDVGDVAEQVGTMEGHIIVPTRSAKDISNAIKELMSFDHKTIGRKHIIEAGLASDKVANQILNIYNDLCINLKK